MSLVDDLQAEVKKIFREAWTSRDGQVVPEPEDIKLGNDAVKLDGTVLYADLDDSTNLVDSKSPEFAAEIYKAYLHCTAKVIRAQGGIITSYDGDRIIAIFIGDSKNTDAARTALKITYAVREIINPAVKVQYPNETFSVSQVVSSLLEPVSVALTIWCGSGGRPTMRLNCLRGLARLLRLPLRFMIG